MSSYERDNTEAMELAERTLTKKRIRYYSEGRKLRVESKIDYWPGTGIFFVLGTKIRGRGITQLINYLETGRLKNE